MANPPNASVSAIASLSKLNDQLKKKLSDVTVERDALIKLLEVVVACSRLRF